MLQVSVLKVANPDLMFEKVHYSVLESEGIDFEPTECMLLVTTKQMEDDLARHTKSVLLTAKDFTRETVPILEGRTYVGSFLQFEEGCNMSRTRFNRFYLIGNRTGITKRFFRWAESQVVKFARAEKDLYLHFVVDNNPTNDSMVEALTALYENAQKV